MITVYIVSVSVERQFGERKLRPEDAQTLFVLLFFLFGDMAVNDSPAFVFELFEAGIPEVPPAAFEHVVLVVGRGNPVAVHLAPEVVVVGGDFALQVSFDLPAAVGGQ